MPDERLLNVVVEVMRGRVPMTAGQIARAASRKGLPKVRSRSVERILKHNSSVFEIHSRSHLFAATRWRLAEAGPARGPDAAGAPVPAWPYRPTLSGAAAASLTFRADEPPADAIGKLA
jgi:hypothetical protein